MVLYVVENVHTNRIMDVHMSFKRIRFVGKEEKLVKKYYPDQQSLNNAYKRYKRRIGKILRRPIVQ